eukprot:m.146955 g.146955  ORF g.146955 m.146955 type:complete len:103 (+) comp14979_c1_seq3:140-448(+)
MPIDYHKWDHLLVSSSDVEPITQCEQTARSTLYRYRHQARLERIWSQTKNHLLMWKPMQEMILTVFLIGERLHRIDTAGPPSPLTLRSLPVEIWEMILVYTL